MSLLSDKKFREKLSFSKKFVDRLFAILTANGVFKTDSTSKAVWYRLILLLTRMVLIFVVSWLCSNVLPEAFLTWLLDLFGEYWTSSVLIINLSNIFLLWEL